ncbi:hypothetical protein NLJ89_g10706 [Agrocybe chaxingu]|uniref:Uncharacterized protein n=1 Tax=Agrocybe chaxingu TaxID=84603 RepID=A0A9W8MRV9_9AGAR|nr:hypothetical protein NLJ89_g10706 [Agrocybe chaxingu]
MTAAATSPFKKGGTSHAMFSNFHPSATRGRHGRLLWDVGETDSRLAPSDHRTYGPHCESVAAAIPVGPTSTLSSEWPGVVLAAQQQRTKTVRNAKENDQHKMKNFWKSWLAFEWPDSRHKALAVSSMETRLLLLTFHLFIIMIVRPSQPS